MRGINLTCIYVQERKRERERERDEKGRGFQEHKISVHGKCLAMHTA